MKIIYNKLQKFNKLVIFEWTIQRNNEIYLDNSRDVHHVRDEQEDEVLENPCFR